MFVIVTRGIGSKLPPWSHLSMAVGLLHPHGDTLLADAQQGLGPSSLGAGLCRGPVLDIDHFWFPSVFISRGCEKKYHKLGLQTRDSCPLTALEARSLRSRCVRQGRALSGSSRGVSFLPLPAPGGPRCPLASGCIPPVSDSRVAWPFLFCVCLC